MDTNVWIALFIPIMIILWFTYTQRKVNLIRKIKRKRRKGQTSMSALVNNYINKDCYISTMTSTFRGIIREVSDGWLTLDNGKSVDAINLDYITQIREIVKKEKK